MNSKKVYLSLLIVPCLLFVYSCQNSATYQRVKEDFSGFTISANGEGDEGVCFADLIDTVEVIKLETKQESLFGDITKMEILNDTIIIFDVMNQILVTFNIKGGFLGRLGQKGNGPGEYANINSFCIDRQEGDVLVLDDSKSKILHFNLEGKFLYSEDAKVYPFELAKEDEYIYYSQNKSSFFFGDKLQYDLLITKGREVIGTKFPFDQELSFRYPLNRVFYEVRDTLCYVDKWNAKVYSILNDSVVPRFHIDFNGNEIPLEYTTNEELFDKNSSDYSYLYDYVVENSAYIYFRYFGRGKLNRRLYDKTLKSYFDFSSEKDESDIIAFTFAPVYSYKD